MFGLSFTHLIILAVIVLIVVGPEQLPEMARSIARMLNEWKRATSDIQSSLVENLRTDHRPDHRPTAPPPDPEVAQEEQEHVPWNEHPEPVADVMLESDQLAMALDDLEPVAGPTNPDDDDDGDKKS